jgi:RNA polymerase sigma factor (sigma-70 family)
MSDSSLEKRNIIQQIIANESTRIESFVRRLLPNREDAKDIVQDVFYKLIVGIEEIRDVEKATSWLYSVARFKSIDFLRKKKPLLESQLSFNKNHEEDREDENLFEWLSNHSPPEQEDQMWQDEIWQIVENTLEKLPEAQKNAFVLHEFEGKSIQEIAELTNSTINTVLSRKRYAVLKLKEALISIYNEQIS